MQHYQLICARCVRPTLLCFFFETQMDYDPLYPDMVSGLHRRITIDRWLYDLLRNSRPTSGDARFYLNSKHVGTVSLWQNTYHCLLAKDVYQPMVAACCLMHAPNNNSDRFVAHVLISNDCVSNAYDIKYDLGYISTRNHQHRSSYDNNERYGCYGFT